MHSLRRFAGVGAFLTLLALLSPPSAGVLLGVHSLAFEPADQPLSLVEPGAMAAGPEGGLYIYDSSRHQVLLRLTGRFTSRVAEGCAPFRRRV